MSNCYMFDIVIISKCNTNFMYKFFNFCIKDKHCYKTKIWQFFFTVNQSKFILFDHIYNEVAMFNPLRLSADENVEYLRCIQ